VVVGEPPCILGRDGGGLGEEKKRERYQRAKDLKVWWSATLYKKRERERERDTREQRI